MPVMEKLLRVPVAEATLFRLVCLECKTAIEVSGDRLGTSPLKCPGCGKEFRRPNTNAALEGFAKSLQTLQQNDLFELQIVLPSE